MEQRNMKSPEYIEFLKPRISPKVKPEVASLMIDYALSEEEHYRVLQQIRDYCFRGKEPVDRKNERPKAFLVIAQTGAGKSNLTMSIHKKNNNIVIIDSDEFKAFNPNNEEIKEKYPQYYGHLTGLDAYLHRDEVYEEALQKGYNILIEIAPSSKELLFNINFEELEHYGYDIEAYILAVSGENSFISMHERYEGQVEAEMKAPKLTDLNRAMDSVTAVPIVIKDLLENHPEVDMNLLKRAIISGNEQELPEPVFVTDDKSTFLDEYEKAIEEDRALTMLDAESRIAKVIRQMQKRNAISAHVHQFEQVCEIVKKQNNFNKT